METSLHILSLCCPPVINDLAMNEGIPTSVLSVILYLRGPSWKEGESVSCSVVSQLLATPWTLQLFCPWDSPGKNTGVLPFPPPGDLPNPGIQPRSGDHCRQSLYCLSHQGSHWIPGTHLQYWSPVGGNCSSGILLKRSSACELLLFPSLLRPHLIFNSSLTDLGVSDEGRGED